MAKPTRSEEPGVAVDARGVPAVDPTANVLALVEAAVNRLDDLRVEVDRRQNTEIACTRQISELHAKHVKEIGDMRAEHSSEMAVAESSRLNAVRAVDVLNGTMAAERAQQAVNVLAATSKTDAENLRTTLATTAASIAQQNAATFGAITERLAALEKSSYEGKGKSTGIGTSWTVLLGGGGFLLTVITIASLLYALFKPAAALVR